MFELAICWLLCYRSDRPHFLTYMHHIIVMEYHSSYVHFNFVKDYCTWWSRNADKINLFWSILMFYLILTIDECIFSVWSLSIFFLCKLCRWHFLSQYSYFTYNGRENNVNNRMVFIGRVLWGIDSSKIYWYNIQKKYISKLNVGRVTLCNTKNYLWYYHVL